MEEIIAAFVMLLGPPLIYALAQTGLDALPAILDIVSEPEEEEKEQDMNESPRGKSSKRREEEPMRPSKQDKRLQDLNDLANVSCGGKVVKVQGIYRFLMDGNEVLSAGNAEEMRAKILGFFAAKRQYDAERRSK